MNPEVKKWENYKAIGAIYVVIIIGLIGLIAIKGNMFWADVLLGLAVVLYLVAIWQRMAKLKIFTTESQTEIEKQDLQEWKSIELGQAVVIIIGLIGYLVFRSSHLLPYRSISASIIGLFSAVLGLIVIYIYKRKF